MNAPQLARVALDLISRSSINPSDENIAATAQARAMLHKIAAGQLVVSEVPKDPPTVLEPTQ